MKRWLLICVGWSLSIAGLTAQVTVEVVLDQEQFLQEESLPVKVRITNRAGQPVVLGKTDDWLNFHIESREGSIVRRRGPVKVEGAFHLDSSKVAMREIDLVPFFELPQGRFRISATVKIPDWNQEILSEPQTFEIVRGTKLWQETIGVPRPDGPPEARRYTLLQANYLNQLYLYVRITDLAELQIYKVLPVGRLLSFSRPEAQVDRESDLHLLFQTGPRDFTYAVVDPSGQLRLRQRHEYTSTRPTLKLASEGKIGVGGGVRRITRYDVPPPPSTARSAPTTDHASPPVP